jgi:two-component system nitrogen regulation sensor histidine kinase NtrY
MGFKSFKIQITLRLALLVATLSLFINLFYTDSLGFTRFLIFFVIVLEIYYLYKYVERSNQEVISFLKTIQYEDFTHTYPERKTGSGFDDLFKEFNNVIRKFRDIRMEKEAQYQYLKTIVQHVGIGIITFDNKGEVQIFNGAARRLIGINEIKNVNQLSAISKELITAIKELRTGGRDLIKIKRKGDDVQLAVYAIELSMQGKAFKLISLQNIQSELEEKEMEAWQNLIRVLTHEIMNSVTPISSLAATVETELSELLNQEGEVSQIENETLEDFHLAMKTIHNRSDSLIKFVGDFRNMTRIRHPMLTSSSVTELVDHIAILLKQMIESKGIELDVQIDPKELVIYLDKEQIEQVVLNLVKNAIEALSENDEEGKEDKKLTIKAWRDEEGSYISIADNGTGIEEEALKKIFIPFFTTKKNGSGIGLSLSKQIMRNHKGSIAVDSIMNAGTEFILRFPL